MNSNKNFLQLLFGLLTYGHLTDAAENKRLNFAENVDVSSIVQIGKTLNDHLITRLTEMSYVTCLEECLKRPRCVSVNYRREFLLCEFNHMTASNIALQDTQGSLYTSIKPLIANVDNECRRSPLADNDLKMKCNINEYGILEKSISDCGTPPSIQRATYDVSNGIGLYSKVTYSCDSGYVGIGRSTISCMDNGTWSNHGFQCLEVCSRGFGRDGNSCKQCPVGTYSPDNIDNCLRCPSNQFQDLQQQDSCMKCTTDDNPCGNLYSLQEFEVVVRPNEDRTECRAIHFCRNASGASIESQNVLVACDRDKAYDGSYRYHWTRPSLHCVADCGNLHSTNISSVGVGQILMINSQEGGYLYCDTSYDRSYWTVIQQRTSVRGNDAFNRTWEEFKNGFGSLNDDYWIGNEQLHRMTGSREYEVLILLWILDKNYTRQRTARYKIFKVESESSNYELRIDNFYEGGSDEDNVLTYSYRGVFSAKDKEGTDEKCATKEGSGWWYGTYWCTRYGVVNALKWTTFYNKTRMLIKPTSHP